MPKKSKGPVEGHYYRFNLGTEFSAADVMFSVWLPGPIDEYSAVKAVQVVAQELEDGVCLPGGTPLIHGRIYLHPKLVTRHMIVDISPDIQ